MSITVPAWDGLAQLMAHRLWLYFTNQRSFGLEMHVATFYNDLRSSNLSQRPHPCLLNAMVSLRLSVLSHMHIESLLRIVFSIADSP